MSSIPKRNLSAPCAACSSTGETRHINPVWLRWVRLSHRLKVYELAATVGVSACYLSQIERGARPVPDYVLETYDAAFKRLGVIVPGVTVRGERSTR